VRIRGSYECWLVLRTEAPCISDRLQQLNRQLDSADLRHYNVRNEQIGRLEAAGFQGFQRLAKWNRVEPRISQNHCNGRCDDFFVIHNKNPRSLTICVVHDQPFGLGGKSRNLIGLYALLRSLVCPVTVIVGYDSSVSILKVSFTPK
jgi:hypothetical protein